MLRTITALFVLVFWASVGQAQSWVQIEAQPGTERAIERAESYARILPDVNAFRTATNCTGDGFTAMVFDSWFDRLFVKK